MQRLGMNFQSAHDFKHPGMPSGHSLERYLLYPLTPKQLDENLRRNGFTCLRKGPSSGIQDDLSIEGGWGVTAEELDICG